MTNTFIRNAPAGALKYFEDKMSFTTGPYELNRAINEKQDVVIVDVRMAEDFEKGHIGGALSLPRDKWSNPTGLRKDKLLDLWGLLFPLNHSPKLEPPPGIAPSCFAYRANASLKML